MILGLEKPGVVLGVAGLVFSENASAERARDVVTTAEEAGVVAIDTARAYATVDDDAAGERIAAIARERRPDIPIITKAGHFRINASEWGVDGGETRLRADAERSRDVLGASADLMLLHRTDRVDDLEVSVRVLASLREEGLVRAIGLSNASVTLIDRARSVTDIDAVQNQLGLGIDSFDEYRYCRDAGIPFFAYAAFGGPNAGQLSARMPRTAALASDRGASAHRFVLAAVLDVIPDFWPIVGSNRVDSVVDAMAATTVTVDDELRNALIDDLEARAASV